MNFYKAVLLFSFFAIPLASPARGQTKSPGCDESLDLIHIGHMPPKGRIQESGGVQNDRILKLEKRALPILIACLTDRRTTSEPIEDYWPQTTVGDIAFFYLCDLFTDSTWTHSTISGVIDWKTVEDEFPNAPAYSAWYEFLKKHGRNRVRAAWFKRWKEIEASVYWDQKELCFKIR